MSLFGRIELAGKPDLENVRKLDLLPSHTIREMQSYGFAIDRDAFSDISKTLQHQITDLKSEICTYIPEYKLEEFMERSNLGEDADLPMNVNSNVQLAHLLFDTLKIGSGRELKRTKSGNQIGTGRRQLEQIKIEHPVVGKVLEYRELAKLETTYASKIPKIARLHPVGSCWCGLKHWEDTWRVHTEILSTRTETGRYASKNVNQQNLPIRSKYGAMIRAAFISSPGTILVATDFSQIELRMLAFLGNVKRMIEVFQADEDLHTVTAMEAFGITEEEVLADKIRYRNPSKNVNFAVAYGESALGLYEQLVADSYGKAGIPVPDWLTLQWCEDFLDKWFGIYPEVRSYMDEQEYRARKYGFVWDAFGRIRYVPEVESTHSRIYSAGIRQAGNMPIQATSAGLMKLVMSDIQQWIETDLRPRGIWCQPLLTVHDELILEVEEDWAEILLPIIEFKFSEVLTDRETGRGLCSVPVKAEGSISQRWEKG